MAERSYLLLPINAGEGFPQSFRLNFGGRTYRLLFYVNVSEDDPQPSLDRIYDLPAPAAFMVMRVTREDTGQAEIIFQRKLVLNYEYEAHELAFLFRRLRVARRNLNGVGAFGSEVLGGVAPR
jgi:hypothetical protein